MKRQALKNFRRLTLLHGMLSLLFFCSLAGAQQDSELRRSLFKDADSALETAQIKGAAIYAPTTFGEGMESYNRAEDDLAKGKELKAIQKKLAAARDSFTKAAELADRSTAFFASAIKAREAAIASGAGTVAAETWKKAESALSEAIKNLEQANDSAARAKGVAAEAAYLDAELAAIKAKNLQQAWQDLKKAEESGVKKNAPLTLEKASRLLDRAEKMLEENRHETSEAQKLAAEAQNEVAHAVYLSQLASRLTSEKKSLEEILLAGEAPLQTIAAALGREVSFDQGTGAAAQELAEAIRDMKRK